MLLYGYYFRFVEKSFLGFFQGVYDCCGWFVWFALLLVAFLIHPVLLFLSVKMIKVNNTSKYDH